jgi:hypothetical protein
MIVLLTFLSVLATYLIYLLVDDIKKQMDVNK